MGIFGNITLAKMKISPEQPGYNNLVKAEESIDRATRLSNQLLTFSKGGEPIKENVKLNQVIEEVALFDLSGSNVKPVFNFPEEPIQVLVDKTQLQQLISNLIINADQSMADGGTITVNVEQVSIADNQQPPLEAGVYAKIEVKDQGHGIADDLQGVIFDPYFSTKEQSSGLGLTTVHSIISKHSGHISLDSKTGKGTTFTIFLPSLVSSAAKDFPQSINTDETDRTDEKKTVLILDDDEMILSLISSILEMNDYRVVTVTDGKQALDYYQQTMTSKKVDAVIMDLTIPGGMGGKETIVKLLELDADAKCIVSSGYADDPIMANYQDYGFEGVISKPFVVTDIVDLLEQILSE